MNALRIALTLLVGSAGGFACWWLQTPLPWMIGAMSVITAAALAGLPVRSLHPLRMGMVTILGVMLGSAFTPRLLSQVAAWPLPLAGLLAYCTVTLAAGVVYFRRVARMDTTTSFFAAAPGGLNEMTIVGAQMGGDERVISLTHGVRILLVVFTIPIWFRVFLDYSPAARAAASVGILDVPMAELAKLGACAVVGGYLGHRLRLPAWQVLGPMIASAAAHMTGLTSATPPVELVSAAQVVMGVGIGCRFAGTRFGEVRIAILHAAVFSVIMLAIAVGFAVALHHLTGLSTAALVLAYAPGGLAEMSLVALALAIDIAFVATHHAVRLLIVLAITPPTFRALRRPRG